MRKNIYTPKPASTQQKSMNIDDAGRQIVYPEMPSGI